MTGANPIGGLMRDPDEAAASMRAWAQGLEQKAQRYASAQRRTEEIRLTAGSPDGSVKVTVRADGSITNLELAGRARSMPLEELSAQILATMHRAQAGIADQVAEVMTEEVGDEDPQTRALLVDNLRSRFPDPDADEDTAPADEDTAPATDPGDGKRPASEGGEEESNPW